MYCRLKDKKLKSRSINLIILYSDKWIVVNEDKLKKLEPFNHLIELCENPSEDAKEKANDGDIDFTKMKKSQIIDFIVTNKISNKSFDELNKFKKDNLIKIAKGEIE